MIAIEEIDWLMIRLTSPCAGSATAFRRSFKSKHAADRLQAGRQKQLSDSLSLVQTKQHFRVGGSVYFRTNEMKYPGSCYKKCKDSTSSAIRQVNKFKSGC